jgi:hypothetical protein
MLERNREPFVAGFSPKWPGEMLAPRACSGALCDRRILTRLPGDIPR